MVHEIISNTYVAEMAAGLEEKLRIDKAVPEDLTRRRRSSRARIE